MTQGKWDIGLAVLLIGQVGLSKQGKGDILVESFIDEEQLQPINGSCGSSSKSNRTNYSTQMKNLK